MGSRRPGGAIASVDPGPAADAGLMPGDVVQSVDGRPVRDVIDWWWLTDDPLINVAVRREGRPLEIAIAHDPGEPLGVGFSDVVFDGIRECENACAFCFVTGLPPGLRPSLYVRDDDYRLSFLSGNFVTLTNVTEDDVARIIEQRLSPLHVSVHAVDSAVRARLVCPTVEDHALQALDRLLAGGIEVHVQVVLVPGVNDGAVLDETLEYLARREGVQSVGTVPMGYTRHQRRWTSSYERGTAAATIARVHAWQARMRESRGIGWVHAADELYLLAGADVPAAEAYDDFPQYENGIGMVAAFVDEFLVPPGVEPLAATLVTGELFAPVLRDLLANVGWNAVRVLAVRNTFLGGNVSVTGLLSGEDIVSAIVDDGARGPYLVPDLVVNCDALLLDDVPADELPARTGANVRLVGSDAGSLVRALIGR